jgi:hypothetical protein
VTPCITARATTSSLEHRPPDKTGFKLLTRLLNENLAVVPVGEVVRLRADAPTRLDRRAAHPRAASAPTMVPDTHGPSAPGRVFHGA